MTEKDITLEAARATLKRLEAEEAARTKTLPLEAAVVSAVELERLKGDNATLKQRVAELHTQVLTQGNNVKNLEDEKKQQYNEILRLKGELEASTLVMQDAQRARVQTELLVVELIQAGAAASAAERIVAIDTRFQDAVIKARRIPAIDAALDAQ